MTEPLQLALQNGSYVLPDQNWGKRVAVSTWLLRDSESCAGVVTMCDLTPDSSARDVLRACRSFEAGLDIDEQNHCLEQACDEAVSILRRVKVVVAPVLLVAVLFSRWQDRNRQPEWVAA